MYRSFSYNCILILYQLYDNWLSWLNCRDCACKIEKFDVPVLGILRRCILKKKTMVRTELLLDEGEYKVPGQLVILGNPRFIQTKSTGKQLFRSLTTTFLVLEIKLFFWAQHIFLIFEHGISFIGPGCERQTQ